MDDKLFLSCAEDTMLKEYYTPQSVSVDYLAGVIDGRVDIAKFFYHLHCATDGCLYPITRLIRRDGTEAAGKFYAFRRFPKDNDFIQFQWNGTERYTLRSQKDDKLNGGLYISVSGQGIEKLCEKGQFENFCIFLCSLNFRCTRIDYACDFTNPDNKIIPLIKKAFDNFDNPIVGEPTFLSGCRRAGSRDQFSQLKIICNGADRESSTYQFGNHASSRGMIRLYDKRMQQIELKSRATHLQWIKDNNIDYWQRFELELHNPHFGSQNAQNSFTNLVLNRDKSTNHLPVCESFAEALSSWLTLVFPAYSHRPSDRCTVSDLWNAFILCCQNPGDVVSTFHFVSLAVKYYNPEHVTSHSNIKWIEDNPSIFFRCFAYSRDKPAGVYYMANKFYNNVRANPQLATKYSDLIGRLNDPFTPDLESETWTQESFTGKVVEVVTEVIPHFKSSSDFLRHEIINDRVFER